MVYLMQPARDVFVACARMTYIGDAWDAERWASQSQQRLKQQQQTAIFYCEKYFEYWRRVMNT